MNLNPLKKDDNTDALVKALEDANNVGASTDAPGATEQPAAGSDTTTSVTDSSVIAADPQITGDGTHNVSDDSTSSSDDSAASNTNDTTTSLPASDTGTDSATDSATTSSDDAADTSANISFDGNDLPSGLSSVADAHLPTATEGTGEDGELDTVKKDALEQLRPLIEKLDLEPADKFDKYLMMLRASDDPALIKPAFEAAQGIGGEKEKAQALLDIINEINYITTNQQQ